MKERLGLRDQEAADVKKWMERHKSDERATESEKSQKCGVWTEGR